MYRGGFADVWKGEHLGRDVAVKVLRMYSNSDLQKVVGVGCWLCSFPCIDVLTESCIEVLQGGGNMENPSASKRFTSDRSGDD